MDINERKNRILALIQDQAYKPMKEKELAIVMQVASEDRPLFKQCLEQLLADGAITVSKRGRYSLPNAETLEGVFSSSGHGYGFVSVEGVEGDFFISEKNTGTALHGDTVLIEPETGSPRHHGRYGQGRGKNAEAVVVAVKERACDIIVGTYEATNSGYGFVIPDSVRIDRDIFIPAEAGSKALDSQKVVVRITDYGTSQRNPQGIITEVLGNADDPGIDVLSILRSYGMEDEFPQEVMYEALQVPQIVTGKETAGREDLRDLLMVTIDGDDTKDIDDAVSLTKDGANFELGVHIADVSHYVREGSALDEEALQRGTSCYPLDRVIPMLPTQLSNGICSLNEDVDRLALSCFMTINPQGEITDHRIVESVIRTDHAMTYGDVNRIITDNDPELTDKYSDVADMLISMHEVAKLLRHRRKERGSVDFDLPETKIELDGKGHPVSVRPHERNNATRLIEDFMLAANETVAEHFFWAETPFVYRIHEKPDMDKIRKLELFIRNFGYGIKVRDDEVHPKELQKLLAGIEDTPEESLISRLTLRSMQRAKYSMSCEGHFGLALRYYCHFTSPIRRYPDLQIHRIIKEYINGRLDEDRISHYESILGNVCHHSSIRERMADEAERECDKLKKAEYMQDHIGEVFEGVISGVTNWGIYVELPNTVEGLVHISKIEGDYFVYNEDNYELVGTATGRRYELGMPVRVVCNMVDTELRTVDFILADDVSALDNDIY
ncbi:MAG: ribonuclease R [Lachnospiraceae bacterium]|nr:ribonuclease R [Lachnospiraceae bacterium]